jgi:hypothetical protein
VQGIAYSIWDSIGRYKDPIIEPQGGDKLFKLAMTDYYDKIKNTKLTGMEVILQVTIKKNTDKY